MYNTKYYTEFKDINEKTYRIEIKQDNYSGTATELVCTSSPFIVEYKVSGMLYEPSRFSTAKLTLFTSDYLSELFTTSYQQLKINLLKDGSVVWTGFINPEIYTQDYSSVNFSLDIECISALASLEYINYSLSGTTVSFLDIITHCVVASKGDYNNVFIPHAYQEPLNNLLISNSNFFDEDQKPMKLKEAIEEVCKFLNWTITEKDGNIYFLDADYIKKGQTEYIKYDNLMLNPVLVNLSNSVIDLVNLVNDKSVNVDNTISLEGGFNKINIIASDYEVDKNTLYPELDTDVLEKQSTKLLDNTLDNKTYSYIKYYYNSNVFDLKLYQKSGTTFVTAPYDTNANNRAGAILVKRTSYETNNKPNKLTYEDVIQVKLYDLEDTSLLLDADAFKNLEVIKVRNRGITTVFDKDIKLAINFQVQYFDKNDGFVKYTSTNKDDLISHEVDKLDFLIPVQLRCGDYYYNGVSWQTGSTFFRLQTDIDFNKHFTYDWLNCKNTNDFTLGVNELEGFIVDFDNTIVGDLELIFLPPYNKDTRYNHRYVFFKNITIKSQRVNYSIIQEKKDTKYENVVNQDFINEFKDIEFRITSKNDSNLSLSKVIYNNDLLDTLTTYDNKQVKPETYLIERFINQYQKPKIRLTQSVEENIQPYKLLYDSYLNSNFIIQGEDIDYQLGEYTYTLTSIN